jgi:hypothetical protein
MIGGPSLGQWLERRALDLDPLAIASVAPPDRLINEAPVGGKVRELMRAAQQQFVTCSRPRRYALISICPPRSAKA